MSSILDFSRVGAKRYAAAQKAEIDFWEGEKSLELTAQHAFYAGYYEWHRNGRLTNPFRVSKNVQNFNITPDNVRGEIIDIGCGPAPASLSLVHISAVHVIDPLLDAYRKIQPFGWGHFASAISSGAESIPMADESVDLAYCRNALDHVLDAALVLEEIKRILKPQCLLLLNCDLRTTPNGDNPHPYSWTESVFSSELAKHFSIIRYVIAPHIDASSGRSRWIGVLKKAI